MSKKLFAEFLGTAWLVLGGIVGAGALYLIASGNADLSTANGFASNGFGEHSPNGHSMTAGLVCELVMTFMFLIVILGATHKRAPAGFGGWALQQMGLFWVAPIVGAIIAGLTYQQLLASDD